MTAASSLRLIGLSVACSAALARGVAADEPRASTATRDLTEMSLAELAEMKVISVSKQPEERAKTAAAIHVVTPDDVKASGATTLVDLLALAPGVHVARLN